MSDFISILTHGRRLQGAVKELSVEELETVADKLNSIIENRKAKELEQQEAEREKNEKLNQILAQLEEAGLDVNDLQKAEPGKKAAKVGKKRPVKYSLKDSEGNEYKWTGIGRMPKVFKAALDSGKSLESYLIN
ncbi:H-NS histone family protein [Paraglaciecola agarilytica]|uniref:H-NS histone family protein n=1 Tax=Paraglaciecola chathamensis TaxID=368405 RepID=UPI001C093812|nr:H-NS family nucleoid-associated regulatory protein [Paraglaciecola agarilytica]MBU3019625.1 H-NS histone family protein [Paraglaciecola agarilytica]